MTAAVVLVEDEPLGVGEDTLELGVVRGAAVRVDRAGVERDVEREQVDRLMAQHAPHHAPSSTQLDALSTTFGAAASRCSSIMRRRRRARRPAALYRASGFGFAMRRDVPRATFDGWSVTPRG